MSRSETVLCLVCLLKTVLSVERASKPVVFSYSGVPHPALISHHYKPSSTLKPIHVKNLTEIEQAQVSTKIQQAAVVPTELSLHTTQRSLPSDEDSDEDEDNETPSRRGNAKILLQPKYFSYSSDPVNEKDEREMYQSVGPNDSVKEDVYAKGGGQKHGSKYETADGGQSEKEFDELQKYSVQQKGHRDKESHKQEYEDEKGAKNKYKEDDGHYNEHHQAEKGEKAAKFGESGEHAKGHSTKGEHNIHKKDEYLKKYEFYDEHHEGGEHEKHGGFHGKHAVKKGGKKKKGRHKSGLSYGKKGKKGFKEKGGNFDHYRGHKNGKGHDERYGHYSKNGKKGGRKKKKKWGWSKKYSE